ncbi:MAG: membrane protein insertase YidC [Chloroflexi bacterium]|nr:MAG: membrane protein insertase YidC [Chloroflexota bacterium]
MGEIGHVFNILFTDPIFNGLMLLYHLFGDFGLSIVVLTLIVKLILFPLTLQQLKSMKATQALQPKMQEIRKKYAKDQQAQALAMQALYKEYGINPVAGCLPLLIQMPVLYGLFFAIQTMLQANTVEKINAHLYWYVPHFTAPPDFNLRWLTFLNANWYISLAHPDPTHILPILAGLATFIQLRMSQPKTAANAPASNDPSAQSMKMMQYFMPLITVVFGWSFAAALALYWTTSSVFQAVQQYFVTGMGSLLVAPNLKIDNSGSQGQKSSTENSQRQPTPARTRKQTDAEKRESEAVETDEETDDAEGSDSDGPIESQLRTRTRKSGPSQYSRRRQRPSSASARRRRGSAQQSRG